MLDSLIQSVENAFVQFSFRRLLYVVFILAIVPGGLYVLNEMTGYTVYRRVDSQIDALQRLHALEKGGIRQSPALAPIFQMVVRELGSQPVHPFNYEFRPDPLLKFLGASLVPLIFVPVGLLQLLRREPEGSSMLTGAVAATFIFGVPALFVPTWRSPWATAGALFVLQVVLVTLFVRWNNARTRRAGPP